MQYRFGPRRRANASPFQLSNRNEDGTWEAPLADRDNILGTTSVDPHEPQWPRWKKTPPLHYEGDFVSDDPFFDIDEISGKVEFYPPGRPLRDGNVDGNPARRQRVDDLPTGNSWRRRLLLAADRRTTAGGRPQEYPALVQLTEPPLQANTPPRPNPPLPRQPTPNDPEFWAVRPPRGGEGQWASRYPFYFIDGETNRALLPIHPSDIPFPSPDIYPPARNGQPAGDGIPDHFQRGAPGNPLNDYLWPYLGL